MSGDLFQSTAFNALKEKGFPIVTRERVVVDKFITVDGVEFEFYDLLETLESVMSGGVYTTFSDKKFAILKANGILECQGNGSWSATRGPNLKEFVDILLNLEID